MSFCTKVASACIFANGDAADSVNSATFCLIAAEASRRPVVRLEYHAPISFQLLIPEPFPPGGISPTVILPAIPLQGGISLSSRTASMSLIDQFHSLDPDVAGDTLA